MLGTSKKRTKITLAPIEGNEHYYTCKEGHVYSTKRKKIIRLRSGLGKEGYCRLWINGKHIRAHRLVAMTFIPNPENKLEVNHISGIRNDNRVKNLEWATHQENIQHAYDTGLQTGEPVTGSKCHMAVINEDIVMLIKLDIKNTSMVLREIAKKHNVTIHIVKDISRGLTWKHVKI